ncbi:MAG: WD40 repeat domain-containing protein [Chloroflexi bacterium]|nr:WD40 repeat domain-containing protein [Chloroflexota bacterium]
MVQWGGPYAFIKWNQITYIYDLEAEKVITTFAQQERVYLSDKPLNFAVSPDGQFLAWIGGCNMSTRGACIWDWAAETGVRVMPNPTIQEGDESEHGEIDWLPTGGMIFINEVVAMPGPGTTAQAIASVDGKYYRPVDSFPGLLPPQVDPASIPHADGAPTAGLSLIIPAHEKHIGVVAWSPDGHWLASAPTDFHGDITYIRRGGHEVRVWDAISGAMVGEFPLEQCSIAIYTPPEQDGLVLASYSAQENGYAGYITAMDWPRLDGNTELALLLNECDDRYRLVIWDWAAGVVTAEYEDITSAAFAPGGGQVALGYADGRIVLTDYPEIDPADVLATLPAAVDTLVFSNDGSRLVAASIQSSEQAGELTAFDPSTGEYYFSIARSPFRTLAVSPDGTTIALAQRDGLYCFSERDLPPTLLDGQTGETIGAANPNYFTAAFSPIGQMLATGGCGTVILDLATPDNITYYEPIARTLAWSPDGTRLAAGVSFGIFVWDLP